MSNAILDALQERLYNSLLRGPAVNCSPYRSRQRLDYSLFERFEAGTPADGLSELLGEEGKAEVKVKFERLPAPPKKKLNQDAPKVDFSDDFKSEANKGSEGVKSEAAPDKGEEQKDEEESPEIKAARKRQKQKEDLLRKLQRIANDADTYQKDTGSCALYLGYPILSIPPGAMGTRVGPSRLLAPVSLIPVELDVRRGPKPTVKLRCRESGGDRVVANLALRVWSEKVLGLKFGDIDTDEEGADPLKEIEEITAHFAKGLDIENIPSFEGFPVEELPGTKELPPDPTIFASAVLGLFPLRNEATIANYDEMREREKLPGTVAPFLTLNASLVQDEEDSEGVTEEEMVPPVPGERDPALPAPAEEHLIDRADPCQRRAVLQARTARGLVVHGPPGTGKSQTIMNIIGDALARNERTLLVCEKRTALDVVKHRLASKGLGHLAAVVHDARHDRTSLYKGVREDLENLKDQPIESDPGEELGRVNDEIDRLEKELRTYLGRLENRDDAGIAFHDLAGGWLTARLLCEQSGIPSLTPADDEESSKLADALTPKHLLDHEGEITRLYDRLQAAQSATNPWVSAHGLTLDEYLGASLESLRRSLDTMVETAEAAANAAPELREHKGQSVPFPPYAHNAPLRAQGEQREALAAKLEGAIGSLGEPLRKAISELDADTISRCHAGLEEVAAMRELAGQSTPTADLNMSYESDPLSPRERQEAMRNLLRYQSKAGGFFFFLQFGLKRDVGELLGRFGRERSVEKVRELYSFLQGIEARETMRYQLRQYLPEEGLGDLKSDHDLLKTYDEVKGLIAILHEAVSSNGGGSLHNLLSTALVDEGVRRILAGYFEGAAAHAEACDTAIQALEKPGLLRSEAFAELSGKILAAESIVERTEQLRDTFPLLESLLRYEAEVKDMPKPLDGLLRRAAALEVQDEEAGIALRATVYRAAIQKRLAAEPELQRLDPQHIDHSMGRLAELGRKKAGLESQRIRFAAQQRQRERLLVGTGSRLNSDATALKRRLMLRGKNASRIREVIHQGMQIEGGDPMFDLRPVWMTSPETAAQIFPLEPIFDTVVFDEASQCRLEEGLPVLARGKRVVIAGDTKQLPPTRFFEVAVDDSMSSRDADEDKDLDADEALFQASQSEIEDLLSAALQIEVEQSYLDVHYRSKNPALIEFSNQAFYADRLQALPGHPNRVAPHPPVRLHHVDGLYKDRQNEDEARAVVERVRELLSEPDPPTVGVATFNLTQRDLINERLFDLADEDPEFAKLLGPARERVRDGEFEGLFVKNLENVQGDERDIILISTTFGIRPNGKFYRNFGALTRMGGERRLNVIITRARRRLELFTSIPRDIYRADAVLAATDGKRPGGGYYLMRYLCFAEELAEDYAEATFGQTIEGADGARELAPLNDVPEEGILRLRAANPSSFADGLGGVLLRDHQQGSLLHYGGDGFRVDLALRQKDNPSKVGRGILCDANRFPRAQDRLEWELFKRGILSYLGWELESVWSPHYARDPEGTIARLLDAKE